MDFLFLTKGVYVDFKQGIRTLRAKVADGVGLRVSPSVSKAILST